MIFYLYIFRIVMLVKIIASIIILNGSICIALVRNPKENNTRRKFSVSRESLMDKIARLRPNLQPSTSSYMEFYYLDNFDDSNKGKKKPNFTNFNIAQIENNDSLKYKITFLRPPFFLLRSNNATYNISSEILPYTMKFNKDKKYFKLINYTKQLTTRTSRNRYFTILICNSEVNNDTYSYRTPSYISEKESKNVLSEEDYNTEKVIPSISTAKYSQKFEYTTAYDRIKFFEIYDSDTDPPPSTPLKYKIDVIENNYEYNRNHANLSEMIDITNGHDHNLRKYSMRHITFIDRNNEILKKNNEINFSSKSTKIKDNIETSSVNSITFSYLSRPASWSDFPFVAVYTYEPAQVRCDCASISPHWLVSSATCLYLHHRDYRTEGISAFVSYCGNDWRHPGLITYVKRSFLHPNFKPLEKTRHYYNMGIIQVTNSMANTCNGWLPIPLMSHQFVADRDGTFATAVGWGLDRYDTRYTISELPLHRLMSYEGLVYSDSCPGNSGYSKAKRLNEESVKNVYCLSLPNYVNEENDAVHGSLLLVGGKLIALYLQEERRPWGEQSAQYTGIWRLIPWLLDVAQEIDEQDPLDTEI